jgi:hypothetical protein
MSRPRIPWRRAVAISLAVSIGGAMGTAWAAFSSTTSNGPNSFSSAAPDTTAPTISRAVVAKTSGGTAGTIRQGGDYYVYAQVTDTSGIATVTTNTSSFDTGVTGASLSSGSWTVGGQTYNYRSAVLSSNTPLKTGTTYSYTVTATDAVGNATAPASYTVAIETYASVITNTAGLVSHWRLGDGAISADELDDTSGTLLSNHTGAVGATWNLWPGQARTAVISNENRLRMSGAATGGTLYYTSAVPPSANYLVEADVHVKSLLSSDSIGVVGRMNTSASDTFYLARYFRDSGAWQLFRIVNGTGTQLGVNYAQTLSPGGTYRLALDMNGSTIRLLVDGVARVTATDTAITAAGRGGVRLGTSATTATITDTAGMHLDNFRITSLATAAADEKGTNNGTYTNGPVLNHPGALAGDSDRATLLDGTNDHVVVPHNASLNLGDGPLTLEAWVKRDDANTGEMNILQKGASAYQFHFWNNEVNLAKDNVGSFVKSSTTVTDTSWHHLVVTKSGTTRRLYIDGIDRTSLLTNQSLVNTTSALFFGAKSGTAGFLKGTIDEFAVYNQALSLATVLDHYKAGSGTG